MAYDTKHAQDIVVSVFRSFRDDLLRVTGSVEFTKKTDNSPVTEWDEAVETKLKEALLDDDPTVGFGVKKRKQLAMVAVIGLSILSMAQPASFAGCRTLLTWQPM